jgi:hypothetical protein
LAVGFESYFLFYAHFKITAGLESFATTTEQDYFEYFLA